MKRAKTSLPVPVSPVSRTVASLLAMRRQVRMSSTSGLSGPWTMAGGMAVSAVAVLVIPVCSPLTFPSSSR